MYELCSLGKLLSPSVTCLCYEVSVPIRRRGVGPGKFLPPKASCCYYGAAWWPVGAPSRPHPGVPRPQASSGPHPRMHRCADRPAQLSDWSLGLRTKEEKGAWEGCGSGALRPGVHPAGPTSPPGDVAAQAEAESGSLCPRRPRLCPCPRAGCVPGPFLAQAEAESGYLSPRRPRPRPRPSLCPFCCTPAYQALQSRLGVSQGYSAKQVSIFAFVFAFMGFCELLGWLHLLTQVSRGQAQISAEFEVREPQRLSGSGLKA